MPDDLIARLRALAEAICEGKEPSAGQIIRYLDEAADALEASRAALRQISTDYWRSDLTHVQFRLNAVQIADAALPVNGTQEIDYG